MGLAKGGPPPWVIRRHDDGTFRLYLCDCDLFKANSYEKQPSKESSKESEEGSRFPFLKLPPEVQLKVLQQSSPAVLNSLRLVCNSINVLISRNWNRLPPRQIGTVAVLQDCFDTGTSFLYEECVSRELRDFFRATISVLYFEQLSCFVLYAGSQNTWLLRSIRGGAFSFNDFQLAMFDYMDGKLDIELLRVQGRFEWADADAVRRALSLREPYQNFLLENLKGHRLRTYCSRTGLSLHHDFAQELPTVGTRLSFPLRLAVLVLILAFFVFVWQFVVITIFIRNSITSESEQNNDVPVESTADQPGAPEQKEPQDQPPQQQHNKTKENNNPTRSTKPIPMNWE
ncbi:unnamed protein product [Heligmosomoides polygyrus]|uniref:F-box domain-containing protein n=1 Tax=Heligmosomoides polygyrus TaxID=6339 RepID=A0A3P7Y5A6_HELPZ|nr:unnamed protein product [Heligmosomoides polygyrus]